MLSGLDLLIVKQRNHNLCFGLNKVKINKSFSETLTSVFPKVEISIDQGRAVPLKEVPLTADLSISSPIIHCWGEVSFLNVILQDGIQVNLIFG